MMSQPRTTRIPAPFYAAAGAGELAYEQLRKLPAVVTDLSGKAAASTVDLREKAAVTTSDLREKAVATTSDLREKAAATLRNANSTAITLRGRAAGGELDIDRLRGAALRNAAVVVAGAQVAQDRALAVYGALVARGERVVGTGVVQAADTVNADMEATEAPAAVTSAEASAATTGPATTGPATAGAKPETGGAKPATGTGRSGRSTPRTGGPAAKSTGPARNRRSTGGE
jgi:heparin binding hemagglutinin HbhA